MVSEKDIHSILETWTEFSSVQHAIDGLADHALEAIRERDQLAGEKEVLLGHLKQWERQVDVRTEADRLLREQAEADLDAARAELNAETARLRGLIEAVTLIEKEARWDLDEGDMGSEAQGCLRQVVGRLREALGMHHALQAIREREGGMTRGE